MLLRFELIQLINQIRPLNPEWFTQAQQRLDQLTKPRGSLGRLEELAARYVAIRQELFPSLKRRVVTVFAADHGVVAEGVSAYPSEVTVQMVLNFLAGGAGINVLARHVGAEVQVVDIGVKGDFAPHPGLISRKIAYGTANLAVEAAMTLEQALQALQVGLDLAQENIAAGVDLLATGEMGIGNTTPAAALAAVFTGQPVAAVTGWGTGIDAATYRHKVAVIERALERHRPNPQDPLGVLAQIGGLEIAGMAGLILGAVAARRPVVLDGFIAAAAALVAVNLCPAAKDFMIAAHRSVEPGHQLILETLGLEPLLDLGMRLGEGTGAVLGMSLVAAGLKIYKEMATFAEAGVSDRTD
ncbi:MAG: nicotinate-nucleotide--dimethylbenzimidazole phosphoribosyltransferase [Desulfobacca sp. 4484_104]|nr:MAG: nicotinate-nucleotide--dimethylbenzimidazole phosphoribosyltransferase [Desulfobacca sp. 4484_104]RLA86611.1 MAG: nicotinate-nucleotide--dimethylbenzimidazole phosphoribosyltransferase [Deltaproteobacteria bacterium]